MYIFMMRYADYSGCRHSHALAEGLVQSCTWIRYGVTLAECPHLNTWVHLHGTGAVGCLLEPGIAESERQSCTAMSSKSGIFSSGASWGSLHWGVVSLKMGKAHSAVWNKGLEKSRHEVKLPPPWCRPLKQSRSLSLCFCKPVCCNPMAFANPRDIADMTRKRFWLKTAKHKGLRAGFILGTCTGYWKRALGAREN